MPEETPIYVASVAGARIRQGEVLSGVVQAHLVVETIAESEPTVDLRTHPLAIVLTQDCDLEQDHNRQGEGKEPNLPSILFCEVATEDEIKSGLPGSDIWRRVRANKDERYQYMRAVEDHEDALGHGLPALGIDFKRIFTVPTDEVYWRIAAGRIQRRCCLVSPYREHLAHRFSSYHARVALVVDHFVPVDRQMGGPY